MTCANDISLIWISVRVLRLFLGLHNNYFKVPKVTEFFPNLSCHVIYDISGKTIVSIAEVSKKLTQVLKLLALVYPKYIVSV